MAFLTTLLARLGPATRLLLALVLAGALLLSLGTYGWRAYQRRHLATQQARATAAHAQAQAAARAAYTAYQLDSTARATERRQLLENARTQHERNEALLHFRPAPIDLPALPAKER